MRRNRRPRSNNTGRTPRAEPPPLRSLHTQLLRLSLPPPPPSRLERWAVLDVWCAQLRKCAGFGFNQSLVHGNGERRLVTVYLNLQHVPRERWDLALVRCRQALELLSVVALADPRAWFELLDKRLSCANLPTSDNKILPASYSKYAPILPRFALKLATKPSSNDDAQLYTQIITTFFGIGAHAHNEHEAAARGFERAKAAVYSRLTPPMLARLRANRDVCIGVRLVFRPPNNFARDRIGPYLDDVYALVSALQRKSIDAAAATIDAADAAAAADGPASVFQPFPFVLEQAMVDLHDTIALPLESNAQQLVALLRLGVQVTQDGIWSPARFSISPASTLGQLAIRDLAPLLYALTTPRADAMGNQPVADADTVRQPKRWGPLDDNTSAQHLEFIARARTRSTFFVRRVGAICAALSASRAIDDVEFMKVTRGYTGAVRRVLWRWLAFALFSCDASPQLQSVTLSCWRLSADDMRVIMQTAMAADPARGLYDVEALATIDDDVGDDTGPESDDGYYDDGDEDDDDDDEDDESDSGDAAGATTTGSHTDATAEQVDVSVAESTDALADSVARVHIADDTSGSNAYPFDYSDSDDDYESDDDRTSDTVVLRAGTTVRVSPFDSECMDDDNDNEIRLERATQCRIIRNAATRATVDIVVPCYGYCTVLRSDVMAFESLLPPVSLEGRRRMYSGALESLDLSFGAGTAAETYLPLVQFVGKRLKVLRLSFDSAMRVADVARILRWCPELERLSLSGAEAGVAQAFVDAYAQDRCKISDLFIAKYLPSPTTLALLQALEDPTSTAARTLTKSLALRPEQHDEATLRAFADMLSANLQLEFLFVTIPTLLFDRVAPAIEQFNRQLLPSQLALDAKLAFLSVIKHYGYVSRLAGNQARTATSQRSETESADGINDKKRVVLHAKVVAKIFQFAAERRYRAVMCYPM